MSSIFRMQFIRVLKKSEEDLLKKLYSYVLLNRLNKNTLKKWKQFLCCFDIFKVTQRCFNVEKTLKLKHWNMFVFNVETTSKL